MVCLRNEQRSFCHFWDCTQVLLFRIFCWLWGLLLFFEGILAHSSRYNGHLSSIRPFQSILVPWLVKCVSVHSCHLLFDHFQFALIHEPKIPGSYAILLFTASDFTSITSHTHSGLLFLLWLHLFILSGVIFPFFSSSILGTYWPG